MYFTQNLKIIYWYQLENFNGHNKFHILPITPEFTTFKSDNVYYGDPSEQIKLPTVLEEYLFTTTHDV
jgi:hypothetical protein